MPYDPTKPAANSPLSSQEMRDQLNALDAQQADTARNPSPVNELSFSITDPPTASDVQAVYDKVNELLAALKRP